MPAIGNFLYPTFKQDLLTTTTNFNFASGGDTIKAALTNHEGVGTLYAPQSTPPLGGADSTFGGGTPNVPALAVAVGTTTAAAPALTGPTITGGTFDTNDFVWTTVTAASGTTDSLYESILLHDTTVTNDRLVAYYDTSVTGLPVLVNGGNINVTVNTAGWFSL